MTDYLHALPPGYRIEEYELVRVLGSGGFGITYLGYDHHLDKAVAIKEYLPNDLAVRTDNNSVLPKSTQDKADYEWGLARFLNEAQTLARFDHRHIIRIHRFFRAHGTGYSVMEYAEGETLSEVLQRKGTLTEAELKAILFPILDGLEAVHEADFLHRDIKPGNIVIRDDGSPVLIDFGSARQAVAGKSRSVTAIVTPGYAPIEQYSVKGHQGPWTDIYGLGAVCYRCLTGEPPDDATERLREDPLVPAVKRCKGKASVTLLDAIDRALRVDEGERLTSVAEWRKMLSDKAAAPAYHRKKVTEKSATRFFSITSLGSRAGLLFKLLLTGVVVWVVVLVGDEIWIEMKQLERQRIQRVKAVKEHWEAFEAGLKSEDLVGAASHMKQIRVLNPNAPELADGERRLLEAQAAAPAKAIEAADEMVSIPGGTFRMGNLSSNRGTGPIDFSTDVPVHVVTIRPFRLGKYEVTFAQWDVCVADGGCEDYRLLDWGLERGNRPVTDVSWDNVQSFIAWLNDRTGGDYRLPTEAEWEYAARAGSTTLYSWGDEIGQNRANCRYDYCGDPWDRLAPVDSFPANDWGLHNMHGNAAEWVQDCWNESYRGAPNDGSAWERERCPLRVVRGGSWKELPRSLRSANREKYSSRLSFDDRVAYEEFITYRNNPLFSSVYRDIGFRLAQDE